MTSPDTKTGAEHALSGHRPAFHIALWESDALRQFMAGVDEPVNVTRMPELPSLDEIVALGAVRVSWAIYLFEQAMSRFKEQLASLRG